MNVNKQGWVMGDSDQFPKNIGRYQIIKVLGAGAMGSVVLAEDPKIKRKVAIKTVKMDAIRNEADKHEFLARFQREAEVSGLLNHPGIVAIYDVGEEEGLGPFLAMEYVAGKPLDSIIKSGAQLPLKDKLKIAAGIADALDHAHTHGIVHRDVKPGNVMITEDGRPKLMDFGIAKKEDASLTQTGTFLGTPSYASPEQIKEGVVDARSDVFSFGVLVFELLSGTSPFPGNSINTILYKIVNEQPAPVQPPVTGILDEGWQRVFQKVLAKKPGDRHASCSAFVRDLMDAATEIEKNDRRELMGLLRMNGMSGDVPVPELVSKSFDETVMVSHPLPASGGGKGKLFALVGGGVAVLAGAGFFVLRGGGGAQVALKTTPEKAAVFVNHKKVGATPDIFRLKAGDQVHFEAPGFQPTPDVTFNKAEDIPPVVTLEPVVSREVVKSDPDEALVVLDGKEMGKTPLIIERWDQGRPHQLTLSKGGLSLPVDFKPGDVPSATYKLAKASGAAAPEPPKVEAAPADPNAPGSLRYGGSFSVQVKVDGQSKGELSPNGKLNLPPGSHQVDLYNGKYFFKESRRVQVGPGQAVSLAGPGLANLTVETFPGSGKVLIDGQDTGVESDGSSIQVAQGRHTVTIKGPKGPHTESVEVNGDRAMKINY